MEVTTEGIGVKQNPATNCLPCAWRTSLYRLRGAGDGGPERPGPAHRDHNFTQKLKEWLKWAREFARVPMSQEDDE